MADPVASFSRSNMLPRQFMAGPLQRTPVSSPDEIGRLQRQTAVQDKTKDIENTRFVDPFLAGNLEELRRREAEAAGRTLDMGNLDAARAQSLGALQMLQQRAEGGASATQLALKQAQDAELAAALRTAASQRGGQGQPLAAPNQTDMAGRAALQAISEQAANEQALGQGLGAASQRELQTARAALQQQALNDALRRQFLTQRFQATGDQFQAAQDAELLKRWEEQQRANADNALLSGLLQAGGAIVGGIATGGNPAGILAGQQLGGAAAR